jgi:hypothetical protein
VDSGSRGTYVSISCPVVNKRLTNNPKRIQIPDGKIMTSTHEAELEYPKLRPAARAVDIVPALHDYSLLSVGNLCDADYLVIFDKHEVRVMDNDLVVMRGHRHAATGLWHVDTQSPRNSRHSPTAPAAPPIAYAGAAIGDPTSAELVAFAHATLFSPTLSTLEKALQNGYLTNFPGLTTQALRRHPPQSAPMVKGHLDQTRKNQGSTRSSTNIITATDDELTDIVHDAQPTGIDERTHWCFAAIIEPTGQIYTDQTGRFVTPSSTGNNYLMVLYDYDSNHIFPLPIKNRNAKTLLDGYKELHAQLCAAGLRPKLQRLDNECSTILKQFMTQERVDFQLVPPGLHRRNAAERAIRTFQNHFIAGLCSVDPNFPLHLWDRLVPQAEITLNLLRGSRINPKLSAWAQVHGQFDFNRTPLGPPGTRVIAYENPENRTTWSPHGLDGWYVGPALDSYRCYKIWILDTQGTRILDTIRWFPTQVQLPHSSSTDTIMNSLHDIVTALRHPTPRSPLAPLTDSHTDALLQLTALLSNIVKRPEPNSAAEHAAPLRVNAAANPSPPIASSIAVIPDESDDPAPAPPLRVEPDNQPRPTRIEAETPTAPPALKSLLKPTNVNPKPTRTSTPTVTFANSTGPIGQRQPK